VGASASALPSPLPVVPGEEALCEVRVRNTGTLVDEFSFEVLGSAAAWTRVDPQVLRLLPATEGMVTLHLSPPRDPSSLSGQTPFGLKVNSRQELGEVVKEGVLDVAPFVEVAAKVVPHTARAWISTEHTLTVANKGNGALDATLTASDPDDLLRLEASPPVVRADPGGQAGSAIHARARKLKLFGRAQHRNFQVLVEPHGGGPAQPIALDATMMQRSLLPWWLLIPLVVIAIFVATKVPVGVVVAAAALGVAALGIGRVRRRRGAAAPPPPPSPPPG
jgi:hypothetical protein